MKKVARVWLLILVTVASFAAMIYCFLYKEWYNQIAGTIGFILFAILLFTYFKQNPSKQVNN